MQRASASISGSARHASAQIVHVAAHAAHSSMHVASVATSAMSGTPMRSEDLFDAHVLSFSACTYTSDHAHG